MSGSNLSTASTLPGYRLDRRLGAGGMGVVYLADDLRLRRRVAVKLLSAPLAQDEEFRRRFLAESRLAASLDHPCVVPIYEAGEAGEVLFISMRYVEGSDLKALLRGGALSAERTVRVCAQIADALDFAHARGLVHRDVKPSNVLLDSRYHVYLADFGLSRMMAEPQAGESGVLGTVDYVAPEQLRGQAVDGRADQYSLACLFYECLVGQPPFAGATEAAILFAHLEEEPPAPLGLGVVMRTALAKEPEDRYRNCGEFVVAAAQALGISEDARSRLSRLDFGLDGLVCPFKGLAFFDRSDADYFCGRERVVSELVARAGDSTLVGILGPSGIGKSSLLRAGVLPALSAGVPPGGNPWHQVLLRPGEHPVAELRRVLGGDGVSATLARLAPGEGIVIAVDQLEEVFTACESEEERAAFFDELAEAVRDPDRRALVLTSLRADFYGSLTSYPRFAKALTSSHVLIGPMDREELARAITDPASRAGLEVDGALVESLVSDVVAEPGALPLLSTMLLELWGARDGRTLRVESYRASGGVRGAVARLAERAFGELDERERAVARGVLLRLVNAEGDALVRRRVPLAELQLVGAAGVVASLTHARLLTISDGEVEVSHEALLHEWPRYREWLEDDVAGRRAHAHLTGSAHEWETGGRDAGELYRGVRLASALEWSTQRPRQLTVLEREFLDASRRETEQDTRRQRTQNRRLRAFMTGATVLSVLAMSAFAFAEIQKGQANQHRRTAQSLALASSAEATLGTDPELSALLALKAIEISHTNQAGQALRDALPQLRLRASVFAGGALHTAAFNSAATEFVTASSDGTARIWSTSTHRQLAVLTEPGKFAMASAAFSTDGKTIVTASYDSTARIWSTSSHKQLFVMTEPGDNQLFSAAFSPDGKQVVTVGYDGVARTWNASDGKQLAAFALDGGSGSDRADAAFSPDGTEIVAVSPSIGRVEIWRVRDHKRLGVLTDPSVDFLTSAAFSPDGTKIVTATTDGGAIVWSARSRRRLDVLPPAPSANGLRPSHTSDGTAGFSPDGTEVVTTTGDRMARVWNVHTGQQLYVLAGHAGLVQTAVFSPTGQAIVTASYDGTAKLWNAAPIEQLGALPGGHFDRARFSPDGRDILFAGQIWSANSYQSLAPAPSAPVSGAGVVSVISPDQKEIVTLGSPPLVRASGAHKPIPISGLPGPALVWSVSSHKELGALIPPPGTSEIDTEFSHDATKIISPLEGAGGVAFWSAGTRKLDGVLSPARFSAPPDTAAFSDNNHEILTSEADGTVRVFSAISGRQLTVITEPAGVGLTDAALSHDGKLVVTASTDGAARVWSVTSNREVGVLTEPTRSQISSAEFSPDGREIVTASDDGTARIWNATTSQQLTVITQPDGSPLDYAAFNPDGSKVVTQSDDGDARVWSTELAGTMSVIEQIARTQVIRQLTPNERRTYLAGLG